MDLHYFYGITLSNIVMNTSIKVYNVTEFGKNLTDNGHLWPQKTNTPSSEWNLHNNSKMTVPIFEEFSCKFQLCQKKSDFTTL